MGMQIGANWRIRWIDPGAAAMSEMYKTAEPIKMQLAADSWSQGAMHRIGMHIGAIWQIRWIRLCSSCCCDDCDL